MSNQLDIFKETQKMRYKAFYDNFYKGVKERYQEEVRAKEKDKYKRISILIKPTTK